MRMRITISHGTTLRLKQSTLSCTRVKLTRVAGGAGAGASVAVAGAVLVAVRIGGASKDVAQAAGLRRVPQRPGARLLTSWQNELAMQHSWLQPSPSQRRWWIAFIVHRQRVFPAGCCQQRAAFNVLVRPAFCFACPPLLLTHVAALVDTPWWQSSQSPVRQNTASSSAAAQLPAQLRDSGGVAAAWQRSSNASTTVPSTKQDAVRS